MLQLTALLCLSFIELHNDEDLATTILIYAPDICGKVNRFFLLAVA